MEAYDNQFNFNFNPNYDECTHRVQYFENQHCANQNQHQYFNNTNINIEENPNFTIPLYDPIIKFNIRFSTGQHFTVQDYPYNLFKSTYDKFIEEQCPVYFKDKIKYVLFEGKRVDFNKTLSQNNITENCWVDFYIEISNTNNVNNNVKNKGFRFYAFGTKQGRRKKNELKINQDIAFVQLNIGDIGGFNLFGVLDGHCQDGHLIAKFCKEYFIKKMNEYANQCKLEFIYSPDEIYNKLKINNFKYITDCFNNADKEMIQYNQFDYNFSGTTCTLVIQLNEYLICANVGDSKSILIYDNDTQKNEGIFILTQDDSPEKPYEYQRIINSGGRVDKFVDQFGNKVGAYRIFKSIYNYPGLSVSRALGDLEAKKCGVISEPHISEYKLNHNSKFMLICSDGVWKYLKNEYVRDLGNECYTDLEIKPFCQKLILKASQKWSKNGEYRDDISVVCIFF